MPQTLPPPHTAPDPSSPAQHSSRPSRRLLLLFWLTFALVVLCSLYYIITAGAPAEPPSAPGIPIPKSASAPSNATPAASHPAAAPHLAGSIGLAAHEVSSAGLIDQKSRNDSGGFERDIYRSRGIEVTLSNLNRYPSGSLDETILWFTRDFSSHSPHVFFADHQTIEVSSASTATHRFDSPLAFGHESRKSILSQRTRTGEKIVAWLIVVQRDQQILAAHGSDADRETLCHDLPALRSLLTLNPPNNQHVVE